MSSKLITVRLPLRTQQQAQEIMQASGYTMTQCVIVAIDALYRQVVVPQDQPPAAQCQPEQSQEK